MSTAPPSTCRQVSWTQAPPLPPTYLQVSFPVQGAKVAIRPSGPANGSNEMGGRVVHQVVTED